MDNRIIARLSDKDKKKFIKLLEKQKLSMQLVLEKYAQKVIYDGRVEVEDWVR